MSIRSFLAYGVSVVSTLSIIEKGIIDVQKILEEEEILRDGSCNGEPSYRSALMGTNAQHDHSSVTAPLPESTRMRHENGDLHVGRTATKESGKCQTAKLDPDDAAKVALLEHGESDEIFHRHLGVVL